MASGETNPGRISRLINKIRGKVKPSGAMGIAAQIPGMVGRSLDLRKAMKAKGKKPTLGEGMRLLLDLPQEKRKTEVLKGQKPPKEI